MYLSDVQKIKKIKDEKRRQANAKRAIERIESTLITNEGFFSWPALSESMRNDVRHLKTLIDPSS